MTSHESKTSNLNSARTRAKSSDQRGRGLFRRRRSLAGDGITANIHWGWLITSYLSLFILGIADNSRGPIFPDLLKQFHLSDTEGGLYFLTAAAFSLANNLLSKWWRQWFAPFRALQFYLGLQAVALVVMGYQVTWLGALVGSSLLGVAMGGIGITQNILTAQATPHELHRRAYSGLHTMYGLSSLLAPILVTALIVRGVAWNQVFLLLAVFPCLLLTGTLFVRTSKASDADSVSQHQPAPDVTDVNSVGSGAVARKWRQHLWISSVMALYVLAEILISTRTPLLARREFGYTEASANGILTLFFGGLFFGRLVMSFISIPWSNRTLLLISIAVTFVLNILGLAHSPWWLVGCGLTMSWYFPTGMALITEKMHSSAGTATAWTLAMNSVGLIVMNVVVGVVADRVGLRVSMLLGPIALVIAFVLLWKPMPQAD